MSGGLTGEEAGESTVDDLGPEVGEADAVEPAESAVDSPAAQSTPESDSDSTSVTESEARAGAESATGSDDGNELAADSGDVNQLAADSKGEAEFASDGENVTESSSDGENVRESASEAEAENVTVSAAENSAESTSDIANETESVSESDTENIAESAETESAPDESTVDGESATVEDEDGPTLDLVDPARLRSALEAVLLVVDQPIDITTLAQTLAVPKPDAEEALHALRTEYDEASRGMDLREVAGGWRLYSRDEFAQYVERFVLDGQQTRLTQAALETLAVIAYRQPVTRSRVSAIRGVGVDAVMRTLTTRALIEECGTDPETGGGLYRTTPLFLEKLGLGSLDDLPALAPLLPDHTELDSAITDA